MRERIAGWIDTHRYCLAGLYALVFFAGFFLMELFEREPEYIIHCALDDLIPFNEYFVLPYLLWFIWVPLFFFYFMFKDRDSYLELIFTMFGGGTVCLIIYFLWPNGLDLRMPIESNNICALILRLVRWIDPPTNVCPSIHVSATVSVLFAILGSGEIKKLRGRYGIYALAFVVTFAICIATLFIKQHSVVDVVCGAALAVIMQGTYIAYRTVKKRLENT